MPDAKLPPQNLEAEQSVLGALLIDKDAIIKVAERLVPNDFYRGKHQKIYTAILRLFERREPADIVTVSDELGDMGELKNIGGDAYLAELVNRVPTAAHIQTYGEIVKETSIRRKLVSLANKITNLAYQGTEPVADLLEETERNIFAISQKHLTRYFTPLRDTLAEGFDRLEELHKSGSHVRGVPTGFREIDQKLAGLQEANLIILAARPSLGKTAMATNIAQYITVHENLPVGFFSLEMSKQELVDRLLSSQSGVDSWKIKTGNLKDEDFTKLGEAMGILAEAPLFIDDTPGASVLEMRTKARRLQMEHGVRLIIVDYIQLAVSRHLESRVQEISEVSQGLKNIARELNCPVLALSQLSRAVEQRSGQQPQLADLRESGALEQDADVVMFLWRPEEQDSRGVEHVKLTIAKHRNGPTGEIDLVFKGEQTRFYSMEKRDRE